MKRIAAIALFLAATFLTTGSAIAEDHIIKVTVPFNFTINSTTLPAGSYTIGSQLTNPAILIIRGPSNSVLAMNLGMNDSSGTGKARVLIFHRYGVQYFLSEVRFASPSEAIFFPATKLEQRAKKHSRNGDSIAVAFS